MQRLIHYILSSDQPKSYATVLRGIEKNLQGFRPVGAQLTKALLLCRLSLPQASAQCDIGQVESC